MAKLETDVLITPKMMREHKFTVTVTCNVKVRYHWRVRLALWLLKLGARIGGIRAVEEVER